MFDGLSEQASQTMEIAKSFGVYNIRFRADFSNVVYHYNEEPPSFREIAINLIGDHADRQVLDSELRSLLSQSGIGVEARKSRVKFGERPVHLKYEELDLIENDSVVYVVVQSEHEANLSSLLEAHPELTGRVQGVVLRLLKEASGREDWYIATFKVHGAGAPKEGTFPDEERTYYEFVGKDFYILNHKVVWKGQVTDRDVAADIHSLLAGNDLVVLTERVPEVKLPRCEDVHSKLLQVRSLFDALSREESGVVRIRPYLIVSGYKIFSEASPPVEKFKCELRGSPYRDVIEEVEEYFTLLEAVKEIFPYVQSKTNLA
jgi:hypothetical protein